MRISPITHNFTRTNANGPSFGKYADTETADLAEKMLNKARLTSASKTSTQLWEVLRDTETVDVEKRQNALWCKINRPYFDGHDKRLRDLGVCDESVAGLLYSDFTDFMENPSEKFEKQHPVKVAEEGLYGPISDPQVLNRLAWTAHLYDPKDLRPSCLPDDESSYYSKEPEPENYFFTRGWW